MTRDQQLQSTADSTLHGLFVAHRHAREQTERWVRDAAQAWRERREGDARAAEREAELSLTAQLILEERIRGLL